MPRWAKIVLIVFGVLVVIGLLVPYVVNVDRFRPQIESEVQKQTGRKLEMGALRARLLPSVGATIENVTLGPPAGFADVNLLTADSIRVSVSLAALLHGAVEVSSVEIVKPHVALATDEHGRTNYDFSAPGAGQKAPSAPSSGSSAFTLDAVSVKDAELSLVDVRGKSVQPASVKISGVSVDLSGIDLSPNGMSKWEGRIPLSGVKVVAAGAPPISFRSGEVKIGSGAATVNYEMEVGDAGRVKGEFSIPDLQKAAASSTHPTPQSVGTGKITADKLRFAPYEVTAVSADVKAFGDHIEIPLSMSVYGGSLTVATRLDTGTKHFSANIQLTQLDLEKVAAADPGTKGKITGRAEAKLQVGGALGGDLLNALTGQGSFALRNGTLPGVQVSSLQQLTKVEHIFGGGQSGGGGGGVTTFSAIDGDLNIHGGRIYTTKTTAETSIAKAEVHGSMGFDETLDFAGTATLSGSGGEQQSGGASPQKLIGGVLGQVAKHSVGAIPLPFSVKGTVKDPKVLPGGMGGSTSGDSSQPQTAAQPQQKKKGMFGIPKP
ncbi:MAG TPA: AsmA family protein [Candidatus Acidoferrales bacterium]|nr:AsmA family protein [Candidatus Acidoferrales bacterium]